MIERMFKRFSPPGSNYHKAAADYFKTGLYINLAISLIGWGKFIWGILRFIAVHYDQEKVGYFQELFGKIPAGWYIDWFDVYFQNLGLGFWLFALLSLSFLFMNLRYLTHESRTFYLLKRLPDKKEILRETIAMPLLLMAGFLAAMVILIFLYYGIYQLITGALLQMSGMRIDLWRVIL